MRRVAFRKRLLKVKPQKENLFNNDTKQYNQNINKRTYIQ